MATRRRVIAGGFSAGVGLSLGLGSGRFAYAQADDALRERNKAAVLRLKRSQGTPEAAAVTAEFQAPDYNRLRGGFQHLAANASGQDFPGNGVNLRTAIPDRVDVIEDVIADGDRVGLLFRVTGTHSGTLFGIPATGRRIDVYELGLYRLRDGRVTEAWFMADEAALLKQLGAQLPPRADGERSVPPVTGVGLDGDAMLARLEAESDGSAEHRNKLTVARSKSSNPPDNLRAADFMQGRRGFEHLREYGIARGAGDLAVTQSLPDRRDKVDLLLAEGDKVWMQFRLAGTNTRSLYGLPPSKGPVEVPEIGIMRFENGLWKEGWYFGDELGLLLQIGQPNALVESA
jgi:predicted ester cyclase